MGTVPLTYLKFENNINITIVAKFDKATESVKEALK
jgi:hypothetical protein